MIDDDILNRIKYLEQQLSIITQELNLYQFFWEKVSDNMAMQGESDYEIRELLHALNLLKEDKLK